MYRQTWVFIIKKETVILRWDIKFIKRCLERRWYQKVFFQREKPLNNLKLKQIKIKQMRSHKTAKLNHSDLKYLRTSGLKSIESSGGRRMNKTQTPSSRSQFSWKIRKQWQYNVKNDTTRYAYKSCSENVQKGASHCLKWFNWGFISGNN